MQSSFSQFLRTGGNGEFVLSRTAHGWVGRRVGLSVKSEFPNYASLRSAFEDRLDLVAAANAEMLLSASAEQLPGGIVANDVPDVSGARASTLEEWDRRLSAIWAEWNVHPQRRRPVRETMEQSLLRGYAGLVNELRQRALGIEHYVWRSRDDEKVRRAHAEYDDRVFRWDAPPDGGHPGQAHNCRCYAEPFLPGISSNPADPLSDPVAHIDAFLSAHGPGNSAGQGVRPRQTLLDVLMPPEPGVTVNGEMLDIQEQGDLASAFLSLDEAVKTDPQTVLDLLARHGQDFAVLANAFGRTAPGQFATAALLAASSAPSAEVDRALTATRNSVDRLAGGVATSLVDAVAAIRAIPDLRWSDVELIARQIYEDPSVLPEALVAPFRERIAVGDYAGALGYGLPEVLAGVAGLDRLRRRAGDLPGPLPITRDMLDADGRTIDGGLHNAGSNAPRFDKWIEGGGQVHMTPEGHFAYTAELDVLGRRQNLTVFYRDGFPDFSPFMTHPGGVRSVEIEVSGDWRIDNRLANIAAGHPEWGRKPPRGWSWHHVEDAATMQLVPREVHVAFNHRGGAAIARGGRE